jgi:TatD DNase family protein
VLVDAHFHADDLAEVQPDCVEAYKDLGVYGLASVHDGKGLARTRALFHDGPPFLLSFGLHPQLPVMAEADTLESLARNGELAAIGECGFDFFGDRPERVRDEKNERVQRAVFDFQLELATRHGLPLVLHMRRANDLLFSYAKAFNKLPGLLVHGWTGPANEALDFLKRCPAARFSFGTSILNGNKKSRESAALLPLSALLTESDAPFQPPREAPRPGARLIRGYSSFEDLPRIAGELARLRHIPEEALTETLYANFTDASLFG